MKTVRFNAVLGSLVVTLGFWVMWGKLVPSVAVALALGVAAFLAWQGKTVATVWAWVTLLVGLESLAWPILTMVRIRLATAEPTEEQMGTLASSVLLGVPFAIFWLTFAYGIFKKIGQHPATSGQSSEPTQPGKPGKRKPK